MTGRSVVRARMVRMTGSKKRIARSTPAIHKPDGLEDTVRSIRLTREQGQKIDQIRGETDFTVYVRTLIDRALTTPEEELVRMARAILKRLGVTVEMLKQGDES